MWDAADPLFAQLKRRVRNQRNRSAFFKIAFVVDDYLTLAAEETLALAPYGSRDVALVPSNHSDPAQRWRLRGGVRSADGRCLTVMSCVRGKSGRCRRGPSVAVERLDEIYSGAYLKLFPCDGSAAQRLVEKSNCDVWCPFEEDSPLCQRLCRTTETPSGPLLAPTMEPTSEPTEESTEEPTEETTAAPSFPPSLSPSFTPSAAPSWSAALEITTPTTQSLNGTAAPSISEIAAPTPLYALAALGLIVFVPLMVLLLRRRAMC